MSGIVLVMLQGKVSCVKGSLVEHTTWQEWLHPSATSWLWPTAQLCCLLERRRRLTHVPNCVVLKLSVWAGKFCWFGTFKLYTCLPSSWGCLNIQVVAALALPFYKYSIIVLFFFPWTNEPKKKNQCFKNYHLQEDSAIVMLQAYPQTRMGWSRLSPGFVRPRSNVTCFQMTDCQGCFAKPRY